MLYTFYIEIYQIHGVYFFGLAMAIDDVFDISWLRNLSVNHVMVAGRHLQKGQQTTIQAITPCFAVPHFFLPFCRLPFSSSRVCANACGARSVEKLLYNPPLQQLGQKFFQVKFNENFCPMQMSLSHTFPLSCWRLVGESHLRLSCSASWLSCYSATVLPPFGVGAMTKRVFQSGTNPFSFEINSNIQY